MRGPLAGSRAALQDRLWYLPDERNNESRGALQGCDDHTALFMRPPARILKEIIDCLTSLSTRGIRRALTQSWQSSVRVCGLRHSAISVE